MPKVIEPIRARSGGALRLRQGDRVDVVNVHGAQVVDTWAFPLEAGSEYMSMEHSRVAHYRLAFRPGDLLYTNHWRPILRFVEDHSPGIRDTLCPACSADSYRIFYDGGDDHDNCSANLRTVLAAHGKSVPTVPTPWNLFMHTVVEAGGVMKDYPSEAKAGDYVSLMAEMDCLFVVSACPQDILPISGSGSPPRGIELHHTAAGS